MTLLFLLIAAAAGGVVLLYEKRLKEENVAMLQNYVVRVVRDVSLSADEKMRKIMDLFIENRFKIEDMRNGSLIAARREFSVGAALLWLAAGGVGLLVYLAYYFLKRPESYRVDLDTGEVHAE